VTANRKIWFTLIVVLIFALAGFIVNLLIGAYSCVVAGLSFSFASLRELREAHPQFYLLSLLPLFSALAGFFAAGTLDRKIREYHSRISIHKKTIDNTIAFARQIEQGDLNYRYMQVNGEDDLADALENMRVGLVGYHKEDDERNRLAEIVGAINRLLRSVNQIEKLGEEITAFLVNEMEYVVQGAFYVVNQAAGEAKTIRLTSTYAYHRKKYRQAEFRFAEGLIGQAAIEKGIILRTEIPADYVSITSGLLGEKKPQSIIIVPLIANDVVHGVIELAAIKKFSDFEVKVLNEISELVARTINDVLVNENTRNLLAQAEKMSVELVQQKSQLEQNALDMNVAQDELQKANVKLQEQIREVHNSNNKIHALLENSLEVIFVINSGGIISYVSPSVRSVLGYFPEELTGKREIENIHPLDSNLFSQFTKDIVSYPEKKHKIQYRYFTKDGEILWLEAIGKNSETEVIKGVVINARDISEQRLAAKEQRIRAKMQALSENSPDLILRIDIFSRCTYVNSVIETITDMKIVEIINKPIMNMRVDESVISNWKSLLNDAASTKEKKYGEVVFPTRSGEKIMQISAIPEFFENGEVESVLFVCHDITEAKLREEVIRKKNKSISDSINYAYNIQNALMPTQKTLQSMIPNSFMFFKPKDIVSGDYPWIYQDENYVYIGVMDCTGHGVPGALMSIIGYFLQNEIVHNQNNLDAGEILDRMHTNVVSTLRQDDPDSKINDGMDAAFCKIDLKNRILNFAGAHRPLYYQGKKEFNEIRGDRFPVGSTQYSKRKNFTNNVIEISPGDAFYLMTDGYADQIGGETGKMKFMSGNVNVLIKDNKELSIFQMGNLFKTTYEKWKGSADQVDDVLIIGFKF